MFQRYRNDNRYQIWSACLTDKSRPSVKKIHTQFRVIIVHLLVHVHRDIMSQRDKSFPIVHHQMVNHRLRTGPMSQNHPNYRHVILNENKNNLNRQCYRRRIRIKHRKMWKIIMDYWDRMLTLVNLVSPIYFSFKLMKLIRIFFKFKDDPYYSGFSARVPNYAKRQTSLPMPNQVPFKSNGVYNTNDVFHARKVPSSGFLNSFLKTPNVIHSRTASYQSYYGSLGKYYIII